MAASLKQKKYRDELGCFFVEGIRLAEEVIKSDWHIESCFYTQEALKNPRVQLLLDTLRNKNRVSNQVTEEIFRKISDTEEPQGILLVLRKKIFSLHDVIQKTKNPLIIVLDEIQDPGNMGTIVRTAAAVGCSGVFLTKGCTDVFGTKTVRATMGALFRVPIVQGLLKREIISTFQEAKISIFSTSLDASELYFNVDFKKRVAIVFGNEGNGVSPEFLAAATARIHIPIQDKVESLNVASSAAVIMYEVVRQRW